MMEASIDATGLGRADMVMRPPTTTFTEVLR
jgi:hypothetical protein